MKVAPHTRCTLVSLIATMVVLASAHLTSQPAPRALASDANTWSPTGSMIVNRDSAQFFTTTVLPDGRVLAAGGIDSNGTHTATSSAELYDPASGTWTATGNMATPRSSHTATLLPNGKVLVAGGYGVCGIGDCTLSSAELYDPSTGTWTATGSMQTARTEAGAILLPNGKVLVAGGADFFTNPGTTYYASAELYDPSTGLWTATGSMMTARYDDIALTLLPTGKVLATGSSMTAELYDPGTGLWTTTGSMHMTGPDLMTVTLLPTGKVLAAGGYNGSTISAAEVYDPATGAWTPTGSMLMARQGPAATLLPNGQVLVAGGYQPFNNLSSAEVYDPATGAWTATGAMTTARYRPAMVLLHNGQVLVAGGRAGSSAELYTPSLAPIPSPTSTSTNTPTNTPTDTSTSTSTNTPTATPTNAPANTPPATSSNTPTRTPTNSPTSAASSPPVAITATATITALPTTPPPTPTATAHVTRPPTARLHRLTLTLSAPRRLYRGDALTVRLHGPASTLLTLRVDLTHTVARVVTRGTGRHRTRHRVQVSTVLFHRVVRLRTDRQGAAQVRLRPGVAVRRVTAATLMVTVTAGHDRARTVLALTLEPGRRPTLKTHTHR